MSRHPIQRALKRLGDIVVSLVILTCSSPVWLVSAILIRLTMGSPILFRQQRPGLHGKPFMLYKFRTMRHALDAGGNPLPDDQRMTRAGSFIRRFSFDELPQLLNVLSGRMSLIGPRPLLMQYLPLYSVRQARRHDVKPGNTGWAQVNGRNAISWPEKFELDVWYVEHWSLWLDVVITWRTALHVFLRKDISAAGQATMPVFTGNAPTHED